MRYCGTAPGITYKMIGGNNLECWLASGPDGLFMVLAKGEM